jgi:hypothetical protein
MDKMNKFVNFMRDYVFARSVIPIGIIVIAIGIYASTIYGDRKDYPRCEATVTDSELLSGSYDSEDNTDSRVYRNYIKYTVDGQEYEGSIDSGDNMKIGSTVTVDYNPDDPTDVGAWTGLWLPILLISLGAAAVIAGCVSIVIVKRNVWYSVKTMNRGKLVK